MNRRPLDDIAGFTLLEALLSVALMGFILVALVTVTSQWLPNWHRGIGIVQRQEALALGIDRLVRDLSAAEYVSFSADGLQPVFRGNEHSVIFVRRADGPNFPAGLELVRLSEVDSRDGPAMVRARARFASAGLDADAPEFADAVAVIRAPYRILFAYSDGSGEWYSRWQQSPRLPRAVRITVVDAATGAAVPSSTIALLHVDAPPRCAVTKAVDCLTGATEGNQGEGGRTEEGRNNGPGQRL